MENQTYLENAILGADPRELVRILYRGAIASTQEARRHLAAGQIMLRSKSISKTLEFVAELALSLNHETAGGLAQQLSDLYGYLQQLLVKAHREQSDAKLSEAIRILETLLSGWADGKPQVSPQIAEVIPAQTPKQYEFYGNAYAGAGGASMLRSWEL